MRLLPLDRPISEFDPRWLDRGTEIELEHTPERRVARHIAAQHLAESPHYYRELLKMERRLKTMGQGLGLLTALDVLTQASILAGGEQGSEVTPEILDYTDLSPWERLGVGNELGMYHAMDPPLRRMAAFICSDVRDFIKSGARTIAAWIRRKITYAQEAPGVELLQGPYDSLRYRTADCDDCAILFLALARSVGIQTYMVGVAQLDMQDVLLHAIGYQVGPGGLGEPGGTFYELIDDSRYGGQKNGLIFQLPEGYAAIIYTPEPDSKGFWRQRYGEDRFHRIMEIE